MCNLVQKGTYNRCVKNSHPFGKKCQKTTVHRGGFFRLTLQNATATLTKAHAMSLCQSDTGSALHWLASGHMLHEQFTLALLMYVTCLSLCHLLGSNVTLLGTLRDIDWIGLSSVLRPRQHSIGYMGDSFYRSKDPTHSITIRVLKKRATKEK